MRELSLNILDITENSLKAGSTLTEVTVAVNDGVVSISIKDNGCGMDKDFLKRVTDPFTTTRTTRKVGMGIPLFKMAAEMCGGTFTIESEKNVGTVVTATFPVNSIDRPPLGNIADTIVSVVGNLCGTDLIFNFSVDGDAFTLDTRDVRKELDGIPIDSPEILVFLRDMINENVKTHYRGVIL